MKYTFTPDKDKLFITQQFRNFSSGICLDFSIIDLQDIEKLIEFLTARKEENEQYNINLS